MSPFSNRSRGPGWRRRILAVSFGVQLVLHSEAGAATSTWNGGSAVDSNFTSAANWDIAPASNNDFVFAGTLRLNANNDFAALTMNTLTFAPGAGAFSLTGNAISLTAGVTNNSGNLQTIGFGGTGVTLGAAQTWTANTAALNVTSAVNLDGFALTVAGAQNTTFTSPVSGSGSLIKAGAGAVEFSGTAVNSYTGTTTVNDGTLFLNGTHGETKIPHDLVIGDNLGAANTAVVRLGESEQIADASNVTIHSDGQFDVGGQGQFINNLIIDRGNVVNVNSAGDFLALDGSLTMTGGSISGGGGGTSAGVALYGSAGNSDVTATSDAAGNAATIDSNLDLSGVGSQMRTFTVDAGPGAVDLLINGIIRNGAPNHDNIDGIIKAGAGMLELTGNNTYTRGTNIMGGTLLANNIAGSATGLGPVGVSGGTLGGNGSVGGKVTLGSGGVIAPGAAATGISTAKLTLGSNLSWDGGGTLDLQLGASNATSDLLAITGNLVEGAPGTLGINTFELNIADAGGFGAQSNYNLITFAGTTFAAATDFTLETLPAGYTGTLVLGAKALTLQVQAVPQAFWTGGQDSVWTTNNGGNTNWAASLNGLTGAGIPGATTDVTFSATGAGNQNTTLGADLTIKSLTVNDPAAVSIGGANKLTIDNTAEQAITVNGGAGLLTISANVALAGVASMITVNNTAGAAISGIITGTNGLIKNGTGTLLLTGNNNYTGITFVRDGTLQLQGPTTNTMIRDTVVVGDGAGAANSAVLESLAGSQIADTVGVTVNSDGEFISGGEGIGALTVNGGTVDTGAGGGLDVASLDMTGGSVVGAKRLGLNGAVTTEAADTTATISTAVVTTFGATQTFTVADGAAETDLLITSVILSSNGSGAVVKAGPGTLELTSGGSMYSGGTTINGGTLLADNAAGSATSSGAVVVNAGGTLGGNGSVTGPVTLNTGGFIAPGAAAAGISTATLTVGGLVWHGGTLDLQLGASNATSDLLTITGALTKGTAGEFGLNITDAGGFGAQPTYTLINFGSTNFTLGDFSLLALPAGYAGELSLDANSLDLTLTGFAASGPIIQNSAPVNTSMMADFMVNGPVRTGTPSENNTIRSLAFAPGSSLTIFNTLFLTGSDPVNLSGGSSLILGAPGGPNGNLSTNQLNIFSGSVLRGNGSIIGNVVNNGLVSPGFSPGTITVTGHYTQTSTGILRIEIGGGDLSQHDLLSVGGSATLGGALQLVSLDNFKLKRDQSVTFLTAAGGVIGRFGLVENGFTSDTILQPTVVYSSNSVALEAVQGSFEKFAHDDDLTPNQRAVAAALDRLAADSPDDKALVYLDSRNLEDLPGDFDKIAPEELTSIFTLGVSLANVQSQNIQRRTEEIRNGSSGFSAAGLAVNGSGPSYDGPFSSGAGTTGPNGDDGKESREEKAVVPAESRWGAFLSGAGEWVNVGNTYNARGYDLESGGFTLGVDYKATPNFAFGLAAGYTNTSADLVDRGRIGVNGGKIGLYATFFHNDQGAVAPAMSKDLSKEAPAPGIATSFYADMDVFGGYNNYDISRSALQGEASGDTDGGELNALLGGGYEIRKGNLTFGPTASFNYTYVGVNEFTEHGSLAPLNIHDGNGDSLRTALGFKASYDWKVGGILIKPEIRAAWQHEYSDAAYALDSSFANGASNSFLVHGPQLGRDSALLGAGFAIQFNDSVSTYFYYDGELGRTNYDSNSVTGGVSVAF